MAVLITGAAAGGAHRLQRILQLSDVIFADQQDLPAALFRNTKFVQIPGGDAFSFAHQLLALCLDHSVDMVFSLRRNEMLSLASAKKLFHEYSIDVIIPDINELTGLLKGSSSSGVEIVVLKDGMVLSGQILEHAEIPVLTGVFVCPEGVYSELELFIVD